MDEEMDPEVTGDEANKTPGEIGDSDGDRDDGDDEEEGKESEEVE